ncbi:hypothetical protein EGR_05362 [Echinococcus granulosus]|uniref:Small EDRK-rich factor-like N-terminal domain-containing protein n=1 Tax=Echinococcus granulosus TaxID=6210 RepID=W6UND1_ECHGR|nr:hypothetical protein EGR_05362 [Echinococcus granulosus]EUB59742.1 hypothetical protein EGR_05362 [Echinococcus granulosus]
MDSPLYLSGWAGLLGHANSPDTFSVLNMYILHEYCVFFRLQGVLGRYNIVSPQVFEIGCGESGNQRELARQKNQQKQKENQKKVGSKDKAGNKGLTLEERRQRDAAALQAKQAKKNSELQQNA